MKGVAHGRVKKAKCIQKITRYKRKMGENKIEKRKRMIQCPHCAKAKKTEAMKGKKKTTINTAVASTRRPTRGRKRLEEEGFQERQVALHDVPDNERNF